MAKKKAAKKPTKKKAAPKKRATTPAPRKPRSAALPGMENIGKIPALDRLCKRTAERREQLADLRSDDKADNQMALGIMQKEKVTTYHRHGVELIRVPGIEKLKVSTSRGDDATGEVDEPEGEDLDTGAAGHEDVIEGEG